ncbi:MAG: clostripain-related cysteine peptidase [Terrimicrobiaceae bacterium]
MKKPTTQPSHALRQLATVLVLCLLFGGGASARVASEPREWTIMVYAATANNLEPYTFRDVAKFTASRPTGKPVALTNLISTDNYGNWRLSYDGDPSTIAMERLGPLHLDDLRNLTSLIRESAARFPARKYALIMQGHGSGWYFSIGHGRTVSSAAVVSAIQAAGISFEIVGLDMCLMSTLETAYEFRNTTKYLIASEDYGPWEGLASPSLVREFSTVGNTRKLLSRILASFIQRNNTDPENDPADMSIIATAGIEPLANYVSALFANRPLDSSFFSLAASVDRSTSEPYPYLQDLYTLTTRLIGRNAAEQKRFDDLFKAAILEYRQDRQKSALPYSRDHHGLGIAVNALQDPTDHSRRYRELSLPLRLTTKAPAPSIKN